MSIDEIAEKYLPFVNNAAANSLKLDYLKSAILEATESLQKENEQLMLRSVGAMSIAEGDEGCDRIAIDCPMLEAVLKLRQQITELEKDKKRLQKVIELMGPFMVTALEELDEVYKTTNDPELGELLRRFATDMQKEGE